MAKLDEYRKKRHFKVTPEPSGSAESSSGRLSYVIQKHAASHLHWDFRIELDGVLLSWAVPKGPSLDPADKRLAMHVEDHPVEYGSFEGVIPKGEYGGGTVMLWDRGTWEPDHADPREHLAEGHLKFYLYGERLQGRWMLVRSKGYGGSGKDSWLLFKERDEEARPKQEFDAVAAWTTSVATGRTMDEISADVEAVWHSTSSVEANLSSPGIKNTPSGRTAAPVPAKAEGARKGRVPRSVGVELATLVKEVPEGERWLHEIKYDGYRIQAFLDDRTVRLISRNGKDWTDRFPSIAQAVAALPAKDAVVDGEVVVFKPDGTNDFQALQNFAKRGEAAELHFMAFDLLHLNGYDLRPVPLGQRKELLGQLVPRHDDRIRFADHIEGHGDEFFSKACDFSLEGVVSKRKDSPYRPGRGHDWVKTKCLMRQEFVVVGYTDPGGGRKYFGALVLAVHEDGGLVHVGRVGTGFSEESLKRIYADLSKLETSDVPVSNPPKGSSAASIHWVRPELVAEVSFTEWTEDRQLRHPSFGGIREDKSADQVVVEEPMEPSVVEREDANAGTGDSGGSGSGQPTVAGVRLTNPDRVLWPDVPFTKLELARYYEAVGELMLPHVIDRPLSLVRCPTGYTGECFYQKHIQNFPSAVATVGVYEPEDDAVEPYAKIRTLSSVIGLVQMGVLEIHPWGARSDDIEKPDRLVFDLDPDPQLGWKTLVGTAQLLRSELDRLGLDSWVKTTGGKGLHVVVPITRRQNWDEAKTFSKAFVDSIVRIEPRMFTSNMSKSKRQGRIYIDYLRNARGATAIAPWGTRARPGAPIAVPLHWEELDALDKPPGYRAKDVRRRLAEVSKDPWAEMLTSRQSITANARKHLGLK